MRARAGFWVLDKGKLTKESKNCILSPMDDGEITVQIVENADKEQIINLYKEAGWWNENVDNENPDLINKIIQGSFCFAVAVVNNKIVGMGRAISDGVSDSYIQDIIVLRKFRGKGIGALIMDEIIKFLKSKNIGWIALVSESEAVAFYEKYGFSRMSGHVPYTLK